MDHIVIIIIGFGIALVLMFTFPLMTVSNTQDEITQVAVKALVSEFVNKIATQGEITLKDLNDFKSKLYATNNLYDIQLEHKILTINPNKGEKEQLGENLYYSVFNETIIFDKNQGVNYKEEYLLNKGDYIICTVKNTNKTVASQIKNVIFKIVGKDTYTIGASSSALVVNTGRKK